MNYSWSISKDGCKAFRRKSAIIWINNTTQAVSCPIAYIKKPAGVSKEVFDNFLDSLALQSSFDFSKLGLIRK